MQRCILPATSTLVLEVTQKCILSAVITFHAQLPTPSQILTVNRLYECYELRSEKGTVLYVTEAGCY